MKDKLLALAERVEAGERDLTRSPAHEGFGEQIAYALGGKMNEIINAWKATSYGSLDAAKALHDAVLPDWEWGYDNLNDEQCAFVRHKTEGKLVEVHRAPSVAAAWVAAILRAKADMSVKETSDVDA